MIKISQTRSEKIGKQLFSYLSTIKNLHKDKSKILSLEGFVWCPPAISTLLTCYILENKIRIVDFPSNQYLKTIRFGKAIELDSFNSDFYKSKSYLPIIKISTGSNGVKRDKMLSSVMDTIGYICDLSTAHKQSLDYILSEFCDNLIDHSKSDAGYISFQYYPSKNYLDLCICDAGQGFLKSYKNFSGNKDYTYITTDIEAIEAVLDGQSTKHLKERGFGVRTSINLIVNGLGGNVIIGSGSAVSPNNKKTISLSDMDLHHFGSFVIIRVPTNALNQNFSFYDYVE